MRRSEELKLIKRAAGGDRAAAEYFVRAYQHGLHAYLYRMCGDAQTSEDIVQDAFVRLLTNLDRFDPRFRFSTWLFTIAKRLYFNAAQKMKPAFSTDAVDAAQGADAGSGGAMSGDSGEHVRDDLQRGLMTLTPEQREVLVLFHQQDWPIWLIAQHLGMPEGTIKSHLHRGRRRLREVMLESDETVRHVGEILS